MFLVTLKGDSLHMLETQLNTETKRKGERLLIGKPKCQSHQC